MCKHGYSDVSASHNETIVYSPPPETHVKPAPIESNPHIAPPIVKHTTPQVERATPQVERVTPPETGRKPIRIKAGSSTKWKDKDGHEWLPDGGFSDGAMLDHGKIKIENTDNPDLYMSERVNVEKFSWPVANGKYMVKLHFSENLEEVRKEGERVFGVDVQGAKIKDVDIFKESGGSGKALVKTVHVNVSNGKLDINFIKNNKEPLINGIEILPE